MSVSGERQQGVCKWFDENKGYGFIERDGGAGDVFVHFRDLDVAPNERGRKDLAEGQRVSFVIGEDDRGREHAEEVRVA